MQQFSAPTRAWFESTFESPTSAQSQGWDAIGRGEHTLILAPTGSGKTLAAFLWAIDRLLTNPGEGCRVLYISPLKALTYDVERNLRAPLAGIGIEGQRQRVSLPTLTVATRTGDTPAEERRSMVRHPPDILITTPESLYLLLTSQARTMLAGVEHVIVDEVHAVAATKRGVHLALSLERLEQLTPKPFQRIGLSATQRPLEELARWLGGQTPVGDGGERESAYQARPVSIVDAGVRKTLEIQIVVPVEDMAELGKPLASPENEEDLIMRGAAAGSPEVRASIWPSIYPKLLELIRAHRSTLIFVNSRRLAERLAARLNEMAAEEAAAQDDADDDAAAQDDADNDDGASKRRDGWGSFSGGGSSYLGAGAPADLVRAHHGSIAREQRLEIEDALKAGRLPALVATSSLELGIDMGAIDLVVQVESPTSVASGLQRIGRAGHQVGQPSRGRIFPKYRHDLLVAAVVVERMHGGRIESTRVPRNTLDVLAQQVVAMVAGAEAPMSVDEVFGVVRRAYSFVELSREALVGVLDMMSGRYPSDEFAELRPRINWDRMKDTISGRPGALMLAVTSGGTIPDRGLFGVFTPEGSRVGELDEEMVYESRVGETFLLGATTWRIEDISKDRVIVTPAPGVPGKMPFWHGDTLGRPYELGQAVGAFIRTSGARSDEELEAACDLDPLALRNLRAYIAEESEATGGLLPTDRQLVVERFRDELGDWRVAVLSPFGARVHAPWAMALEAKLRDGLGLEVQAIWSDDGIILRLPETDDDSALTVESVILDPDQVEDLVLGEVGKSALFASRFRENAARSLLLARRRPGQRTPLWQLRQRAADLLAVASRYGSFPVLLETYRECLRDVFDLPALVGLMADIKARRVRVATVDVTAPSPFASSLAFAYVAQFMYEGDAPLAERRAQALTLDRRMLAELVGSEELRDLLDAGALAGLEIELQCLEPNRYATSVDNASDLLRRLGDLSVEELHARCVAELVPVDIALVESRRAVMVRIGDEPRLIAAEDAGRYRDGLGIQTPPGLPAAFVEPVPDALVQLVRRWARTHGPFHAGEPAARFGLPVARVQPVLDQLRSEERLERGEYRPDGTGTEWCDVEVLRILRQRSLAALRREVEPTEVEALARFLPLWQGVRMSPLSEGGDTGSSGVDRLYEVIAQLQGLAIPASVLESEVLSARVRGYSPRMLDELLAAGEVIWVGAGSIGRTDGRVVLALRDHAGRILDRLGLVVPEPTVHTASGLGPRSSEPADPAESPPVGLGPRSSEPDPVEPPAVDELHDRLRSVLSARGACFFRELSQPGRTDLEVIEALWDLVWSGEVTNDSFTALRHTVGARPGAPSRSPGRKRSPARPRPRLGSLGAAGPPRGQGRWSLVRREIDLERNRVAPTEAGVAVATLLLERYGIVTREAVRGEGVPGGFAGIYPVLRAMEESGRIRRGYFVAGLGGAQFALPGAVDRLREVRDRASSFSRSGDHHAEPTVALVLAATDPANAYGLSLPWPTKGPQRVAGARVVLVDGIACLYLERGGKTLVALADFDGTWEEAAVSALVANASQRGRIALAKYPDELEEHLRASDFVPTPKGMVRYA